MRSILGYTASSPQFRIKRLCHGVAHLLLQYIHFFVGQGAVQRAVVDAIALGLSEEEQRAGRHGKKVSDARNK